MFSKDYENGLTFIIVKQRRKKEIVMFSLEEGKKTYRITFHEEKKILTQLLF